MSSKPSPDGILSVKLTIDRLAVIDREAQDILAQLAILNKRKNELQEETNQLVDRLPKILRSMDVGIEGNYGFEQRLAWALRELAKQYKEEADARTSN